MKKFWLIFLLPLILISCPKEEIAPEDNVLQKAEAQIGPAGATLEVEGISLMVPPGSFPILSTVSIISDEEHADDFKENRVTPIYRIDGIPARTEGPFTIRIKYQGNLTEESYMAMGESDEMLETGEEETTYAVFDAIDSSGYLISEVPTFEGDPEEGTGLKSAAEIVSHSWLFLGVSSMKSYEGKYFSFKFPSETARQKLFVLSEYMDEAMQAYFELKLSDLESMEAAIKLYKKKPRVLVTSRAATAPGAYSIKMPSLDPLTKEEGGMAALGRFRMYLDIKVNISETHLATATDETLKSYAYMWVYRMLYYLYLGDRMDWYAHASVIWMKEKYTGISDYTLLDFLLMGKSPFLGMEAGKKQYKGEEERHSVLGGRITKQVHEHSIGMTPFLQYLDQRYPNDKELYIRIIREIIQSDSKKAMEGIINAIDEPEYLWWPGFFEKYLTRQLVDIPAKEFLKLFPGVDYQVDFFYEKDTTLFNEAEYADLSARLYNVSFLFPSFEKEATLNLKIGPPSLNMDYVTFLAFGLKDNLMEYFDRSDDLTITSLKALKENDYSSIVVAVINCANEPTTDETLKIEFDTRLQTAPEDLNYVLINSIEARSTYTDNSGSTYEGSVLYRDGTPRKGEMVNNTFTATWNEPYSSGTSSGSIVIEFDPLQYPRRITGISITETRILSDTRTFTIKGENIDFPGYKDQSGTIDTYNFYASREEVCNYLTYINQDFKNPEGTYAYSTDGVPICDDKSGINMSLYYLEE